MRNSIVESAATAPRTVVARARGGIDNQNGLPRAEEEFSFESAITH
jgi:hypothetical protein